MRAEEIDPQTCPHEDHERELARRWFGVVHLVNRRTWGSDKMNLQDCHTHPRKGRTCDQWGGLATHGMREVDCGDCGPERRILGLVGIDLHLRRREKRRSYWEGASADHQERKEESS